MKKMISMILAIVMSLTVLAACGSSGGSGSGSGSGTAAASVDSLKTIGDVIALESEETQRAVYDGKAIFVFKLGDTYYRATASISEEDQQAYFDVDFSDADFEQQQNAIVESLPIEKMENLNEQILSQDEMDALIGKTGQELQDAGWTYSGHDLEDMEFWMNYGPFLYTVTFDGEVAEADYETFEDEEGTKAMTVKSVKFNMLGDAT